MIHFPTNRKEYTKIIENENKYEFPPRKSESQATSRLSNKSKHFLVFPDCNFILFVNSIIYKS